MLCISTGFAGGSAWNSVGGGSNYLCLRSDPIIRMTDEDRGDRRVEIHGAEYRDPPNLDLTNHAVPCAVCAVTRRLAVMMPGTNLCDEGWSTEYVGYVASARTFDGRYRNEFECVDEDVEASNYTTSENEGGAILYPAQTICGSLPCLPYIDNKDLLCVVCSR